MYTQKTLNNKKKNKNIEKDNKKVNYNLTLATTLCFVIILSLTPLLLLYKSQFQEFLCCTSTAKDT